MCDMGYDFTIISGGKGIRGPQDTGLILGKGQKAVELIQQIRKNSGPAEGVFGRQF